MVASEEMFNKSCPSLGHFPTTSEFLEGLGMGPAVTMYTASLFVLFLNVGLFIVLVRKFFKEVSVVQIPNLIWVNSLFTAIPFFICMMIFLPKATEFLLASYRVYEAVVISRFVELNLMWYGGEKKLLKGLGENPVMRFNLPPFCCLLLCLRETRITRKWLKFSRLIVYQMVYIQVFALFLQLVLHFNGIGEGHMSPSNPVTYIKLVARISFMFGLWGLFIFFNIERTFSLLSEFKYMAKFTIMKITLIIFILQETIIEFLAANGHIGCSLNLGDSAWGSIINCSLLMVEATLLGLGSFYYYYKYPSIDTTLRQTSFVEMES